MRFIYTFVIRFYNLLIKIGSVRLPKAKQWVQGRQKWREKLTSALQENTNPVVWIHCSSLGEFEQGRPVIEEIKAKQPNVFILLTFFSPSGYEIRKNYPQADFISYLPLDTPKNAKDFLRIANPSVAIFVKYEFWYNYLNQLRQNKIPFWLISGIFRKKQHFFAFWGGWFRKHLHFFDHLYVQNQESGDLLKSIHIQHYTVAGDTRFDRVKQIALQAKVIPEAERFVANRFVFVAGSSWPADEDLIATYINQTTSKECFIIAPHEIHKEHIDQIVSKLEKPHILFSQIDDTTNLTLFDVLIVDNIGMLSALYRYANVVMIGGGFGKGIHNILEPAVYGVPILIGPKFQKFREAVDLIERNTVFPVNNYPELETTLRSLRADSEKLKHINELQNAYIEQMSGSTKVIVERLTSILSRSI